jgi:hypothetical protein
MGHEISQFDIPDRQLLMTSNGHAGIWSDIGKAKITRSIFGRPKVRVIREKDKLVRMWLLAALALMALAVAAWQGWSAYQQNELQASLPLSERISVGPPVFHPEIISPAKSAGRGKSESLIQTEIDSLVSNPNGRPPKPPDLNATKPKAANIVTARPSMESKIQPNKPQTAPLATNKSVPTNQTGAANQTVAQSHPGVTAPVQSAAPTVIPTPVVQPAAQLAPNKPAQVAPPAEPLTRNESPISSSASNNQPTDNANAEPQANARGTAIIFEQPDNSKP